MNNWFFIYMDHIVQKNVEGMGAFNNHSGTILFLRYPLSNMNLHINSRTFLVKIQSMNLFLFSVLDGPGELYIESNDTKVS